MIDNHSLHGKYYNKSPGLTISRGSNFNISTSSPAYQYYTQKKIQNTVRVPSSLYAMNLGALNVYESPLKTIRVNWNQMSDRAKPSFQTNSSGSQGSFYHGSSLKHSQTRDRPGAGTPGGYGVDIKHNSYYRYLGRLKGKGPVRRGVVPPTFGQPIPFNCAFPVYGGKTVKTSIVSGCPPCAGEDVASSKADNILLNKVNLNGTNSCQYIYLSQENGRIQYSAGQIVYARESVSVKYQKSSIFSVIVPGEVYAVLIGDSTVPQTLTSSLKQIIPYFPCNCLSGSVSTIINGKYFSECAFLNKITVPDVYE